MILRIIGIYHFVIGLLAILLIALPSMFGYYTYLELGNIIFGIAFMVFGYLTFKNKNKGLLALLVLNVFQLFTFQAENFEYRFFSGLVLILDLRNFQFYYFFVDAFFDVPFLVYGFYHCFGDGSSFSINLVPLAIIFFLIKGFLKNSKLVHPWELDFQK